MKSRIAITIGLILAIIIGGSLIIQPQRIVYWKRVSGALHPTIATNTIGSSGTPVANIYATAATIDTLTADVSASSDITITKDDPSLILDAATAGDTDFWLGVQDDGGGDNDDIFQIGGGTAPGSSILVTVDTDGDIGIGTATIPHGGIGWAKFAIEGANGGQAGPHIQYTTSADDYPLFQQLNYTHDNITLFFDAYYDSGSKSSDIGSNYRMLKINDKFEIQYDSGIAQGDSITWNNGIVLNALGNFGIGTTPLDAKLHIRTDAGASGGHLRLQRETTNGEVGFGLLPYFGSETGAWWITAGGWDNPNDFVIGSLSTDAALIIENSTGDIGIGIDEPENRLHVFGTGAQLKLSFDDTDNAAFGVDTNGDLTISPSGTTVILDADLYTQDIAFRSNSITVTNFKTTKISVNHDTGLFDATGAIKNVVIWTQPVNSRLIHVMMRLETQFSGVSMDGLTVTIGIIGTDDDGLVTTTGNLTTDAEDSEYENAGAFYDSFYEGIHGKTNAAINWDAKAVSDGANLDATTAGTLDFYFMYEQP